MNAKLTLSLNKDVIELAKSFAREQGVSVSKMFENFIKVSTSKERKDKIKNIEISDFVKSLSVEGMKSRTKEQRRDEYYEYLKEKY